MDRGQLVEFDTPHQLLQNPSGYFTEMVAHTGTREQQRLIRIAEEAHNVATEKTKFNQNIGSSRKELPEGIGQINGVNGVSFANKRTLNNTHINLSIQLPLTRWNERQQTSILQSNLDMLPSEHLYPADNGNKVHLVSMEGYSNPGYQPSEESSPLVHGARFNISDEDQNTRLWCSTHRCTQIKIQKRM